MRAVYSCCKTISFLILAILLIQSGPKPAFAQKGSANQTQAVNTLTITYQGRLTDANGNAVVDGDHTLTFKLYDQPTDGSALWQETQNLTTSNGVFTAKLGSVSSMGALLFDKIYYLGVAVDGGGELTPRTALSTVPYAQRAHSVDDSVLTVSKLDGAGASKGQVLKWDGSQWVPAADEVGSVSGSIWNLSGNTGTSPGNDFLGTTDDKDLVLKVNNAQALRFATDDTTASIILGDSSNTIGANLSGSVIGGGGWNNHPNTITNSFAVVGGGFDNTAGGLISVIGGGSYNKTSDNWTTVGGGYSNEASGYIATVAGGNDNTASATKATVSGGDANVASGLFSSVGGGYHNNAENHAATISGGRYNLAPGEFSTISGGVGNYAYGSASFVAGGRDNVARGAHSFAGGRYARANHDGSFVWNSYSTTDSVSSSGPNQFIVMADGGVGFGTTTPDAPFQIASQNHWDLVNSEGDFKIGNDTYRLKMGIAMGGGGAGSATIMADGGTGKLILGSNKSNVVTITKSNGFYPSSDNTYSLGTSSNRWSTVYAANGTVQTSDRRLKTGIRPLRYGLKDILKLKPVSYRWKKNTGLDRDGEQVHLGLIAQEVQQVIGEVVDAPEGDQKYYGMNYTALVPVLIKAVQQQEQQIDQLKGELQEIRQSDHKKLKALQAQVQALAAALQKTGEEAGDKRTKTAKR